MPSHPFNSHPRRLIALSITASLAALALPASAQTDDVQELGEVSVTATAEQQLRQAVGVSTITAEDIAKRPPANDLSELIRTMPGVNLSGASSTGAFGNQRQIDLRGMGPENTLILIDGKPVQSRNSSMMRRTGERNTRGDSNWVPASAVDHIEVLRGPAAARYGSGAAGGVINIITKKPADKLSGEATVYYRKPQESDEGDTRRLGFNLAGPLAENFSFRLYGNVAKTDRDAPTINQAVSQEKSPPAGKEGVRNRDINGLLRWDLTPSQVLELEAGLSRQGNIYSGERFQQTTLTPAQQAMTDSAAETNRVLRRTLGITHRGDWGTLGKSRVLFQYENTNRKYLNESPAGGPEGSFTDGWSNSELKNYYLNGELYTPLTVGGLSHMLTTGMEFRREKINDPGSQKARDIPNYTKEKNGKASSDTFAVYLEDNIAIGDSLMLTPGLRLDHQDQFGNNWSPSLNATYQLSSEWSLNAGVARAFKAPNIYQSNADYIYFTRGNGCPAGTPSGVGCFIQGNPDLKPETSINKEIGLAWNNHQGWDASLAYFDNDYKNKIIADMPGADFNAVDAFRVYRWINASKAKVRGLEGSVNIPLLGENGSRLKWFNNVTYMAENKNKSTNQPLSIIPKYTLNSTLDWSINSKFSTQLTATLYGRQKPRTIGSRGESITNEARGSYALFGLGANYEISKNLRAGFGIENLANRRLLRTANGQSAGAASYNEPGRAYYLTVTGSF